MIVPQVVDRFLSGVSGQPLREGTRYARAARVGAFNGSPESVTSVVRGRSGDFEVALWVDEGGLQHRCSCPSWRDPCKHEVAAALVLRQVLTRRQWAQAPGGGRNRSGNGRAGNGAAAKRAPGLVSTTPGVAEARRKAIEERRAAARREQLRVTLDAPPFLSITSPSGFAYRVGLRGGADGPHS